MREKPAQFLRKRHDGPIGTIMSRLSRARRLLMAALPEYAS